MKKFIKFQEAGGKTPEKILPTDNGYIIIYDDSYCRFGAEIEYEYGDTYSKFEEKAFDFSSTYEIDNALKLDIIDKEEKKEFIKEINKQRGLQVEREKEQKKALLKQLQKEMCINKMKRRRVAKSIRCSKESSLSKYWCDYPNEPIGGGNPYYRCSFCGISDPQINGRLENHAKNCEYRLKNEV
jgi:hypothetical protein